MSSRPAPPPVVDNNPPRAPRAGRPAPPPADTPPTPAPPTAAPEPRPSVPGTDMTTPAADDLLSNLLTAGSSNSGQNAGMPDPAALLMNLAALREKPPVDPMNDYVSHGTRLPRFVSEAMQHYASMTGRKLQEVLRDAVLGTHPIPTALLDAHRKRLYPNH